MRQQSYVAIRCTKREMFSCLIKESVIKISCGRCYNVGPGDVNKPLQDEAGVCSSAVVGLGLRNEHRTGAGYQGWTSIVAMVVCGRVPRAS